MSTLNTAEDAAAFIARKAEEYAENFGFGVAGTLTFDTQVKMDYYQNLLELADEIRGLTAPLTEAQRASANYLHIISQAGFIHAAHLADIDAYVQSVVKEST